MAKYEYKYSAFKKVGNKKAEKKTSSKTPYKFLMYVSERK